jgi:activator of HSP90 ATPase
VSTAIHQQVEFEAAPHEVFDALTRSERFASVSSLPATIEPIAGGRFQCFGGQIAGRFVEIVPDALVVLAWRVAMWPAGVYSIARFELQPHGTGTRLVLDHAGFPEEHRDHLDAGWHRMYWKPLARHLEGE